ncbi:MAG: magnesium/cobalt transporter CorA [Bacillota bacterium]
MDDTIGGILSDTGGCEPIEVIEYDADEVVEFTVRPDDAEALSSLSRIAPGRMRWINVDGKCTQEDVRRIAEQFKIHPIVAGNIYKKSERTRIEEYDSYLYIVAKMIYYSGGELIVEHEDFILGENYVLSFGEERGDVFDGIRSRIRSSGTQVRKFGADYLMYSLLEAIVDGYFDVLEAINEKIDALEEAVMENTDQGHLRTIRAIKKDLLRVNRCVWPLRDVASLLGKESTSLIRRETAPYLRDVYGHIVQVIDSADTSRELLSGLAELHLSNTSNKLNEIMKILTVISTIFIPLTFIVGVYGMNFHYMPELESRWGYGVIWAVMLVIGGIMIAYFKRKKWF